MRAIGLDLIGDVPWGTHLCQFYQDQQDLVDILVPYFAAGLEQNEFCMWVTSEPLGVEEAKAALAKAVGDLEPYLRSGQLEILDYREWYTATGKFEADRVLQGWVDKLAVAQAKGFSGLRLTGNTLWLEASDWQDFTEYEATVDRVIGQYKMLAICTYSLAKCGAPEILDVMKNHDFALIKRDDAWQVIQSAERGKIEESLRRSEARHYALFNSMQEGLALHEIICDASGQPVDYRFLEVNPAFERLTGLRREEILGKTVLEVLPGVGPYWIEAYGRVALSGEPARLERFAAPLGRWYAAVAFSPEPGQFAAIFSDVTARKSAEWERDLTAEFLGLVNRSRDMRGLLRTAADFFHQQSGCEAMGIRLRERDDYPYVETRGFPSEFVQAESDLCARDADGNALRDESGLPVLGCMCGSVVCGRFDSAETFFTEHGSFWTNSTSALLAEGLGADPSTHLRNRCHDEGYESVALIPLHLGGGQLGLLQLNDRKEGAFSPEAVGLWERLADHLAIALTKLQAEEALRDTQADLMRAQAAAQMGSWRLDVRRNELSWSDEVFRIFGIPEGTSLTYEDFLAAVHPEDREYVDRKWAAALRGERYDIEHRVVAGDAVKWVRETAELEFDREGTLLGGFGTVQDITERRQIEQERIAAEKLRAEVAETVAAEIDHRMKNNLMLLSGLLEMQLATRPAGGAAAEELRQAVTRVSAMSVVHEHLYAGRSGSVELKEMLRRIAEIGAQALAGDGVDIKVTGDTAFVPSKIASALSIVANELITNALKHGRSGGDGKLRVEIVVSREAGKLCFRVWNSGTLGAGSEELERRGGLGLQLVRGVTSQQLGGSFALRALDGGTVAEVVVDESALAPMSREWTREAGGEVEALERGGVTRGTREA